MSSEQIPAITISASTPDDYEACLRIQHRAALDSYPNEELGITAQDIEADYSPYLEPSSIASEKERLTEASPNINHHQLIAKENGEILGFTDVVVEEGYNQVMSFYVDPKQQSRGIGQQLWSEAQKLINNDNPTIVHVLPYNQKAIAFYEKLGFEVTATVQEKGGSEMQSGAVMPKPIAMIRQ